MYDTTTIDQTCVSKKRSLAPARDDQPSSSVRFILIFFIISYIHQLSIITTGNHSTVLKQPCQQYNSLLLHNLNFLPFHDNENQNISFTKCGTGNELCLEAIPIIAKCALLFEFSGNFAIASSSGDSRSEKKKSPRRLLVYNQ